VFLSHNVPFDTELDRIRNEESPKHGRHYGSLVVRDVVQQRSLKLNVAGHMHEGEGRTRVGDTTCINTGIHTSQVIDTSSLND
jgi:Icc-related predicted phosphoesterase